MPTRLYSQRLGLISDEQFAAALERFQLGRFVQAEAIPSGLFGQNVFVTSTTGEYVLRGDPHFSWQFPTERFITELLHERSSVPVPWPYLVDPSTDLFGWSYVLMPRMPGLQLADQAVRAAVSKEDQPGIARAMAETLAQIHDITWPFAGRYDASTQAVQPFNLPHELAWPFPLESQADLRGMSPALASYSAVVVGRIRRHLTLTHRQHPNDTTTADMDWAEDIIAQAQPVLATTYQPCLVLQDYQRGNLVVTSTEGKWRVSGVFDLMQAFFGDGEADLSRTTAAYLEEDPRLAEAFVQTYLQHKPPRPGFAQRFALYMLDDRLILWDYFLRHGPRDWPASWTLRDWASRSLSLDFLV